MLREPVARAWEGLPQMEMPDQGGMLPTMCQPIPMFDLLGVRPIYVEDLRPDALILIEDGLVLIRAGLSSCRITQVVDQVLTAAADSLPVAHPA